MSSLRLALKQSLEEANPSSIKEREQEKKEKKQRQKQRLRDDSDGDDSSDDDSDHDNHNEEKGAKKSKAFKISSNRNVEGDAVVVKRKRGRPKGSTNKKKLDDSPNKVTSSVGSNANKQRTIHQSESHDKEMKFLKKKKGKIVKENAKEKHDGKGDVLQAGIRQKKKMKKKSKDKAQQTHHLHVHKNAAGKNNLKLTVKQNSPDDSDDSSASDSEQEFDSNSSSGDSSSESSGSVSTGSSSSDSSSGVSDVDSEIDDGLSNDGSSSSSSSSSGSPPFSPSRISPLKSSQKKEHDRKVHNQTNDVDEDDDNIDQSGDDDQVFMDGVFDSERSSDDEERPGENRVEKKKRSSLSTESLMSIDEANSQQLSQKKKNISITSSQSSSNSRKQINLSSSTKSIGTIQSKSSRDLSEQKRKHKTKVDDDEEASVGMKTSNTLSSVSITTDHNGRPITKKRKQKSVIPPTMEVLAWVMGMSQSQQRSEIKIGMRVKVRFTKPKVKWYGGVVTLVGSAGTKIRILYDDGTSESTHFPDKEIVVDDTGNGSHEVNADAFKPSKLLFGANIPMRISSTKTPSVGSNDKNYNQTKELSESSAKDSTVSTHGSPKLKIKSNEKTDNNTEFSVAESQQQQHPLESTETTNVEKVNNQDESLRSSPLKSTPSLSVSPKHEDSEREVHVDQTTLTVENQTLSVTTEARRIVEVDVSTKPEKAQKTELQGFDEAQNDPVKIVSSLDKNKIQGFDRNDNTNVTVANVKQESLINDDSPSSVPKILINDGVVADEYEHKSKKRGLSPKEEDDNDSKQALKRGRKEKGDDTKRKHKKTGDDDKEHWVQCEKCMKWRLIPSLENLPEKWYCELNVTDLERNSCDAEEQTQEEVAKRRRKKKKAAALAKGTKRPNIDDTLDDIKSDNVKSTRGSPVIKKSLSEISKNSDSGELNEEKGELDGNGDIIVSEVKVKKRGRQPKEDDGKPKKKGRKPKEEKQQEWVQCEKCEKWRRLPPSISAKNLPDTWYCSMNTWDPRSASCAVQDDFKATDETNAREGILIGAQKSSGGSSLSYRDLIRKPARPISERMRAAESIFSSHAAEHEGEEMGPPQVTYFNSSAFQKRIGINKSNSGEKLAEDGIGLFELMGHSNLWKDLSKRFSSDSHLVDDEVTTCPLNLQAMVHYAIGSGTKTADEILFECQCGDWDGMPWTDLRATCTIDIISSCLKKLEKDGLIERVNSTSEVLLSSSVRYKQVIIGGVASSMIPTLISSSSSSLSGVGEPITGKKPVVRPLKKRIIDSVIVN